ncbi:MAG: zinc ribbon domain-containing protein [Candidatus Lokiarchaeota archaeon]|nr:zinc ribbon domain-containing protein [Candidatus Lokiarchaeota archaeon]
MQPRSMRKNMQNQDTETLFNKKISMSVIVLVMASVTMVLQGIIYGVHSVSPINFMQGFIAAHVPVIAYAVCLLVFSIIGKNKGKENQIMAFVFGICTIVLNGLVLLDRGQKVFAYISAIIGDVQSIVYDAMNIVDIILRSAMLGLTVVAIVFSIFSIVNSAGIIKENVPSSHRTVGSPAGTAYAAQPVATSSPPATAASQGQFCSACGAPLDAGAAFCNKCGAKV